MISFEAAEQRTCTLDPTAYFVPSDDCDETDAPAGSWCAVTETRAAESDDDDMADDGEA